MVQNFLQKNIGGHSTRKFDFYYTFGLFRLAVIAQPVEIAGAALYLVSDAASFTTGTSLICDGGMLA